MGLWARGLTSPLLLPWRGPPAKSCSASKVCMIKYNPGSSSGLSGRSLGSLGTRWGSKGFGCTNREHPPSLVNAQGGGPGSISGVASVHSSWAECPPSSAQRAHKGPANKSPGRPTRARPQGPRDIRMGLAHKGPVRPTRALEGSLGTSGRCLRGPWGSLGGPRGSLGRNWRCLSAPWGRPARPWVGPWRVLELSLGGP